MRCWYKPCNANSRRATPCNVTPCQLKPSHPYPPPSGTNPFSLHLQSLPLVTRTVCIGQNTRHRGLFTKTRSG